ncbi:hypothetical protein HDF24_07855 [Mucilaginibacter sp. X4EP1]|uniref:hypothetical protein n=1 Tax=Mucilaginibacter sp. X4EP1 TaxID=2723092 RepID=UPI0021692095|nr:hypothetical protein [Mucilaginibacter sp. X4EP1]MCS3814230.1 hypothetical protein [Mucilaginibacter sp. X4EP1]
MKKFKLSMILIIIITFGFIKNVNAQKQSEGLYLTYNDYLNHKLSYTTDKISIHEFIGMKNVTVISNGKKIIIPKSQLFGYHDSNNNDYRFNDDKAYQIIDTTGFYIYSYDKLVQQGKGPKPTRVYFFSKKTDDAILPLTAENIAVAFPKNTKFKYMVEVASKSDIKLDAYDAQSNEYKIKELYTESLK